VRMLDGRIDTQGTVEELQEQGVLDDIAQDSHTQVEEPNVEEMVGEEQAGSIEALSAGPVEKKPRKLVKDEHREIGGVKWHIYNTYLKASFVLASFSQFSR
jgi:hypothetical protein